MHLDPKVILGLTISSQRHRTQSHQSDTQQS
jgi:hypothetical protein